ncbi:MAG: MBL fold metallo-hydrolase [Desulfocucumaceae bacterium]
MCNDAVLLTHTHRDHFDREASRLLPKGIPVLCQPEDEDKLSALGFSRVYPIGESLAWQGVKITRTGGRHGTGAIEKAMGPVSGYVLQTEADQSLYITGDTIWCPEVESPLKVFSPQIIIVFSGAARFTEGDPITMTAEDVAQVCRSAPGARVVAVHLEALNHCFLTRDKLRRHLQNQGLTDRAIIPGDGEWLEF